MLVVLHEDGPGLRDKVRLHLAEEDFGAAEEGTLVLFGRNNLIKFVSNRVRSSEMGWSGSEVGKQRGSDIPFSTFQHDRQFP